MKINNKYTSKKERVNLIWLNLLKNINNSELEILLNTLLSQYEKDIISNRLAAISMIRKGKTYKEIGEELWLSSTTISSLKKILDNNLAKEYQTYRQVKNLAKKKTENNKKQEYIPEPSPFFDAIDSFFSKVPRRTGFRGTRRF